MNLLSEIKLLFTIRKPAMELIQEVKMLKSGWKSSEFWLTLLSTAGTIVGALSGVITPQTAAIITAVVTGLYTTLRSVLKVNAPADPASTPPA